MSVAGEGYDSKKLWRVAIVMQGWNTSGGIRATAQWLRKGLEATGRFSVDVHDVASSRADLQSRRLLRPLTWARRSLLSVDGDGVHHWGANAVEVEPMRYRPRAELTRALNEYDLVQIVVGAPAMAAAASRVARPVMLMTATLIGWERASQLAAQSGPIKWWRAWMTRMTQRVERRASRHADYIFVINDQTLQHYHSAGYENVAFAPPGVDTEAFTPPRAGRNGSGHLLSVCRLGDTRKALDRLVHAYERLIELNPEAPDLVLAGKGQLPAPVSELIRIRELGDRIRVVSDVPPEDLVQLLRNASVFVQSSKEEGLGISVLEAMACGLPVVATDTAGSRETVVDGVTGWLIEQTTEYEIAQQIAARVDQLLRSDGDFMGARGRARAVSDFSDRVTMARIVSVYDSILGR